MFWNENEVRFEVVSFRSFKDPKLKKPKELSGIKQVLTVPYIPKRCSCPVFIKDQDVWMKHRDYFSPTLQVDPEDIGTTLVHRAKKYLGESRKNRFVYPDSWGEIVLRQEAWICFRGLIDCLGEFPPHLVQRVLRLVEKEHGFEDLDLMCTNFERMIESMILSLRNSFS